ncbi:3-oxoadipate enol-lactonase [Marinibaculum pumilum]|uniref:3-oxoadipate enol-lactonase n=1 Tax=Marinibaculum pumilum TaxID=1766165 RepID=A0ABV7KWB9_9PROT
MQAARIGSTVLHYSDTGAQGGAGGGTGGGTAGPALVFANSLGTDLRVWDPLLPHLPAGLRILRYDKRGHGLSDCPPGPYAIDDLVGDLSGLLDHAGVSQAVVVGLSVGGMIAQGIAATRPDVIRGAVFCCTAHVIGTAEMWAQRIAGLEAGGIEGMADAVMERWFSPAFRSERGEELAAWRNMLTRTPLQGYAATCAALRDADLTAQTAGLKMPVLCIAGSNDGSTPPEVVQGLADLVPGARLAVLDGPGHIPCVEAPEALGAEITAFLKENGLV